jgi:hypothetical protein
VFAISREPVKARRHKGAFMKLAYEKYWTKKFLKNCDFVVVCPTNEGMKQASVEDNYENLVAFESELKTFGLDYFEGAGHFEGLSDCVYIVLPSSIEEKQIAINLNYKYKQEVICVKDGLLNNKGEYIQRFSKIKFIEHPKDNYTAVVCRDGLLFFQLV